MARNWSNEELAEVQRRLVPRYPADENRADKLERAVPSPPRRNRRPEEALQSAIVAHWRPRLAPGARLLATNGELPGGAEQARRAGRRKQMGYLRGTPDLLAKRRDALVWIEVKVPPNKPTAEQAEFARWAIEAGDGWAVATSVEDAGAILSAWGMLA
jgi:hypothetical protein